MSERDAFARTRDAFGAGLREHIGRLGWDRRTLAHHRTQRLRTLLAHAQQCSPFHAERLSGIDPSRFEIEDLAGLPTMTKAEMMADLDRVFTDRRLTRAVVEEHVATTGVEPSWLVDDHIVLASGGSSGERGVFVYGCGEIAEYLLGIARRGLSSFVAPDGPLPEGLPLTMVAAASGLHATRVFASVLSGGVLDVTSVPVTAPLPAIVARVNELQPLVLQSYPSVLSLLAREQRDGRLRITPIAITGSSEQFPAEIRAEVRAVFGAPVTDSYGCSEGLLGWTEPDGVVFTFNSDQAIVELVDDDGRPVEPGVPADRALVTNLVNLTQPLIRYELDDRFVEQVTEDGTGYLRATVEGRRDDVFTYDEATVHPVALRRALLHDPAIVEYQVHQTPRGIATSVVTAGDTDLAATGRLLADALADAGLAQPTVEVVRVEHLARHPETGKVRRFVPLTNGRAAG